MEKSSLMSVGYVLDKYFGDYEGFKRRCDIGCDAMDRLYALLGDLADVTGCNDAVNDIVEQLDEICNEGAYRGADGWLIHTEKLNDTEFISRVQESLERHGDKVFYVIGVHLKTDENAEKANLFSTYKAAEEYAREHLGDVVEMWVDFFNGEEILTRERLLDWSEKWLREVY